MAGRKSARRLVRSWHIITLLLAAFPFAFLAGLLGLQFLAFATLAFLDGDHVAGGQLGHAKLIVAYIGGGNGHCAGRQCRADRDRERLQVLFRLLIDKISWYRLKRLRIEAQGQSV